MIEEVESPERDEAESGEFDPGKSNDSTLFIALSSERCKSK